MLLALLPLLFLITLVGVCGYALTRGGREERSVAIACAVAAVLSLAAAVLGPHWRAPEWGVLTVDIGLLAFLGLVALKSDRYWPLWACAFQLVAVLTHVAIVVDATMLPRAYSLAQPFWAYPVLFTLILGTIGHSRKINEPAARR